MKNFLLAIVFILAAFFSQPSYADDGLDCLINAGTVVADLNFGGADTGTSPVINFAKDELGGAYAWFGDAWIPVGTYAGFDGTYHWIRVPIAVSPSSPLDQTLKSK